MPTLERFQIAMNCHVFSETIIFVENFAASWTNILLGLVVGHADVRYETFSMRKLFTTLFTDNRLQSLKRKMHYDFMSRR